MAALKPNIGDLVKWTDLDKYIWVGVITNIDILPGGMIPSLEENKFSIYWLKKPEGRDCSDYEYRTTYHPNYQFGNLVMRIQKNEV